MVGLIAAGSKIDRNCCDYVLAMQREEISGWKVYRNYACGMSTRIHARIRDAFFRIDGLHARKYMEKQPVAIKTLIHTTTASANDYNSRMT